MPELRIPLFGNPNTRGFDAYTQLYTNGKDQRFQNVIFQEAINPISNTANVYVSNIPQPSTYQTPASGKLASAVYHNDSLTHPLSAFNAVGAAASTIYAGTTNCGQIIGTAHSFHEVTRNGTVYYLIAGMGATTNQGGWYLAADSFSQTAYTGDTTNGSAVITNIASTAGMYSGQLIEGSGINNLTRILTVDSSTQITMTANATATATGVSLTKTPVAKILDSDFPSDIVGGFTDLDGFIFIMDEDGNIYNSDLNSITSWTAGNYIPTNTSPDVGVGCLRYKDLIVGCGSGTIEFFVNTGNGAFSPLTRVPNSTTRVGVASAESGQRPAAIVFKDTLYFISSQTSGNVSAYKLNGTTPEKISSQFIDSILSSTPGSNIFVSAFEMGGKSIFLISLQITNPSSTKSFAYSAEDKTWVEWTGDFWFFTSGKRAVGAGSSQLYSVDHRGTGGVVYVVDLTSFAMTSEAAFIQTSMIDPAPGVRKFVKKATLIGNKTASGSATLAYSDDDYANFTTWGTMPLTELNPQLFRGGSHVGGRSYKITLPSGVYTRLSELVIDYELGVH